MKFRGRVGIVLLWSALLITVSFVLLGAGKAEASLTVSHDKRAQIEIHCLDNVYAYADSIITPTDHTVAETLSRRKINADLDEKLRTVDRCVAAGAEWREAFKYCFPLLPKIIERVITEAELAASDSTITFLPDSRPMFAITREQAGRRVDETRLYRELYIALRKGPEVRLRVTPEVIRPKVTVLDNIKLTNLRSRFSTDYSLSNDNRKHNIKLSLSKINGKVLLPGEEFSFNKTVGRRTESNGFKEAKIIVAGEYKEGYGGGVCQASTTVYNAALRADMHISFARNHSLLPAYVSPSFDAMVNSGSSDMRFVNNGDTPVFIRAVGDETKATVEFYGTVLPYKISTESVEISRGEEPGDQLVLDVNKKYITEELPAGTQVRVSYSHPSLKSQGYIVYKDRLNRVIERKLIRSDTYNKSFGIIAVAP